MQKMMACFHIGARRLEVNVGPPPRVNLASSVASPANGSFREVH